MIRSTLDHIQARTGARVLFLALIAKRTTRNEIAAVRSAVDRPLSGLGVPSPLNLDLGRRSLDVSEVVRRQFQGRRREVLLKPVQLCGSRDWHDPRLLREKPRERDLRRGHFLLRRDTAEQFDQSLVCPPIFR